MVKESSPENSYAASLPLIGSLLFTGAAVAYLCVPPRHASLTWPHLFTLSIVFLVIAVIAHLAATWAVCRVFQEHIQAAAWPLGSWTWGVIAWLPLLAVLAREHSIWIAIVIPLMAAYAVFFISRLRPLDDIEERVEEKSLNRHELFQTELAPPQWKSFLLTGTTAAFIQAGVAVLLIGLIWTSGFLFALGLTFPVWLLAERNSLRRRDHPLRTFSAKSAMMASLLALALTPLLIVPSIFGDIAGAMGIRPLSLANPLLKRPPHQASDGYSGIILTAPPEVHKRAIPQPPSTLMSSSSTLSKPLVIKFDGQYWYFKWPDPRPRPDARVQRGDTLKAIISSADFMPLEMEAHQSVFPAIDLNCCRSLRLALTNADNRAGAISVEVRLKNSLSKQAAPVSLGSVVIPSSTAEHISLTRPPVQESLTFQIPTTAAGERFDEITVLIKPARERSLAGAQVAVREFAFVP